MKDYMKQLTRDATPTTYEQVMSRLDKIPKQASVAIIKNLFNYDPLPDLNKYPGPKMIVSTIREEQQPNTLSKSFPAVTNKIIDGTSHWVQMDKPAEFNTLMDEFIRITEKD
jgi:pimeloyl-ACP methyl ester carboxylesterase